VPPLGGGMEIKMTIIGAITEVLNDNKPRTSKKIYEEIVLRNLYSFGAKKPESVVNGEIRCHCEGLDFPSASPVKHFIIAGQEGKYNLYLNKRKDEVIEQDPDFIKQEFNSEDILPEEKMDLAYLFYKNGIKQQLLDHILECHPSFFEQLVINLLLEMGYGSDELSGRVLGKSHDGGIDGVIYEDKLGLSKIYIQAKRNDSGNTIGRPLLQAFVGAMQDVQKGVFITTSTFTKEARNYAEKQQQKSLKLIDGDLLAELMIKYGIGLEKVQTYTVYKINEDFFE
jgi:restriction system protein